jgi:hypothetical protein
LQKTTSKNLYELFEGCLYWIAWQQQQLFEKHIKQYKKDNKSYYNYNWVVDYYQQARKLWQVTIYSNPINWLENPKIQELEKLYTSLYNVIYNNEVQQDLFGLYRLYYSSTINKKGLKIDLKSKIEFEASIHYFIMNILEDKINIKEVKINKSYIQQLYTRFLCNNTIQDIEDNCINWQAIEDNLQEYVNNKIIIDNLNSTWKLDKLQQVIKDIEDIQQEFKLAKINKDKAFNKKEYHNKLNSLLQKRRVLIKDLKSCNIE